jgi:hypothetical protein
MYAVNDGVDPLNMTALVTLIVAPPLPLVMPPQGDYNWTMSNKEPTFGPPPYDNILSGVTTPNPGGNLTVLKVTQPSPDGTITLDGPGGGFSFTPADPKWSGERLGCQESIPVQPISTHPSLAPKSHSHSLPAACLAACVILACARSLATAKPHTFQPL